MTSETVTVEMDVALVHEGKVYKRGDRLAMTQGDALDLQALAFAHVIKGAVQEVRDQDSEQPDAEQGDKPEPRPVRSVSRNRYMRRDRRDETP
jgi:hypothetical protein